MKIVQSQIELASQRSYQQQHTLRETLNAWVGERPGSRPANTVAISNAGRAALQADAAPVARGVDATGDEQELDPRTLLLKLLIEALTGEKINIRQLVLHAPDGPPPPDPNHPPAPPAQGYGVEYDRHEEYHESEHTGFSAEGTIKTADGKEINFHLELQMAREFHQSSDVSIRLGDAARQRKDPLVINFDGKAAELSGQKIAFDIDADGNAERFSFLGAGSGFLALDRNGNGRIDDGRELFGAQSGDGFSELATLDGDGNGWIDENDAVFQQLRVWTRDTEGKDQLHSLQQANVGAVFLGSVGTDFALKTADNQEQGVVRRTGVYLREDGQAGTVQKVDVTV